MSSPQKSSFNPHQGHSKLQNQSADINYTPYAQKTQHSRIEYDFDNAYFSQKKKAQAPPKQPVKVYPMMNRGKNQLGKYSNIVKNNQLKQINPMKRFNSSDRSSLNSNPPPHHYLKQKIEVTPHRNNGKSAGARRLSTQNVNEVSASSNSTKKKSQSVKKDTKSQLVQIGYRQISMSYHALPGDETPANFLNPNFIQKHQADLKNLGYVAKNFKDAAYKINGAGNKRSNSYANPYDAQKMPRSYPKQQKFYQNLHQLARGPINVQDDHNQTSSAFSVKSNASYRPKQRVSPAIAILQEYQNKGKYYQLGGLGPYTIGTDNWKAGKARLKAINDFSNNLRSNNLVYKSFKDQIGGNVEIYKNNGSYSMIQQSPYQYISHQGSYCNNISQYGNSFVGGGGGGGERGPTSGIYPNEFKYSIGCPPPKIFNQQQQQQLNNVRAVGGRKSSIGYKNLRETQLRQIGAGLQKLQQNYNIRTIDYSDSKSKKHPDMISRNDISLGKSSSSKNFVNNKSNKN